MFSFGPSKRTGRMSACKACTNTMVRKYQALNPEIKRAAAKKWNENNPGYYEDYRSSPKGKYKTQMKNAEIRGIPWEFTFDTWWKLWEESGKWDQRGRGSDQYQMCRTGDTGPYSPSNVRIDTTLSNHHERRFS